MSLRNRIEELERLDPGVITLTLDDGTSRSFPGLSPVQFCTQAGEEFKRGGGPISDAILRAVSASRNMGRLHELLRAKWIPFLEAQGIEEPAPALEAAPVQPFRTPMPEDCPKIERRERC